jgi:glycosyltransferase involved in cell wall biosynthesis
MSNTVKVLQFSTHNEECGIAKYQEQFIEGMSGTHGFYTEFFPYSPNKTKHMSKSELQGILGELKKKMVNFDILHIQHELSFFKHSELEKIISTVRKTGKKVMVTVHTAPAAQYQAPRLGGLGPKSWAYFLRKSISARRFLKRYVEPLKKANLIIVHNGATRQNLISHGVSGNIIQIIKIPVPLISQNGTTTEIRDNLNYKKGDIIFCSVGFMSRMKGVSHAIKALLYLPENYKLAIIGGVHPDGGDEGLYDELTDLISTLRLKDRVYITGYIKEDGLLNSLIRECDICVYPYDKKYYSYVSSAAINNAIANHKAVIAYQTKTFIEINIEMPIVTFTRSANYYELARELNQIDIPRAEQLSREYAEHYAYDKEAQSFINIYRKLAIK